MAERRIRCNLGLILRDHGLTEAAVTAAVDGEAWGAGRVNQIKNSMRSGPSMASAWRLLNALRRVTGKPLTLEDVWPNPNQE